MFKNIIKNDDWSDLLSFSSIYVTTTFPNGKQYGQTYSELVFPYWNPRNRAIVVLEAYIYDNGGNFTDIKNNTSVSRYGEVSVALHITFNSSYVGKLFKANLVQST